MIWSRNCSHNPAGLSGELFMDSAFFPVLPFYMPNLLRSEQDDPVYMVHCLQENTGFWRISGKRFQPRFDNCNTVGLEQEMWTTFFLGHHVMIQLQRYQLSAPPSRRPQKRLAPL